MIRMLAAILKVAGFLMCVYGFYMLLGKAMLVMIAGVVVFGIGATIVPPPYSDPHGLIPPRRKS